MWAKCWAEWAGWWHTEPCQPFSDDFFLVSTAWARFEPERAGYNFPLCWETSPIIWYQIYIIPDQKKKKKVVFLQCYTSFRGSYSAVGPGGNKTEDLFIWVASWVKLEPLVYFTKITLTS